MFTNEAWLIRKWALWDEILPNCSGVAEWRSSLLGKGVHCIEQCFKPVEGLIHMTHPGMSEECSSNDTSPFDWFWQCSPTSLQQSLEGRPRSWNHRMVWVGRDLQDHPIPKPCHGRYTFHQTMLLKAPPSLEHFQDGASTTDHFFCGLLPYWVVLEVPYFEWHHKHPFRREQIL